MPIDPLTAALNLATEIVKLIATIIETTPPEQRAAMAERELKRMDKWLEFVERVEQHFGGKRAN